MKEIRYWSDTYLQLQKIRIATNNQIGAMRRDGEEVSDGHVELATRLESVEGFAGKMLEDWAKNQEIWAWLKEIKGIGLLLGGQLTALVDMPEKDFGTVSKLWAYAGLSVGFYKLQCAGDTPHKLISAGQKTICPVVVDLEGNRCGAKLEVIEHCEGGIRRIRGWRSTWNPHLKVVCWKIGEQFVKSDGFYRGRYEQFRAYYDSRADLKDSSKGLRYAMAKRKTVKLFLCHLWIVWRSMLGLPVSKPYAIEKMGHQGYVPPPYFKD